MTPATDRPGLSDADADLLRRALEAEGRAAARLAELQHIEAENQRLQGIISALSAELTKRGAVAVHLR